MPHYTSCVGQYNTEIDGRVATSIGSNRKFDVDHIGAKVCFNALNFGREISRMDVADGDHGHDIYLIA